MPKPTYEQLQQRVQELESQERKIEFKVSDKGGVSVYGLGRFPVTLYYEQWVKLLSKIDDLKRFIEANKTRLKMRSNG